MKIRFTIYDLRMAVRRGLAFAVLCSLFVVQCLRLPAAVITGSFKNPDDTGSTNVVRFTPRSTPVADDPDLVITRDTLAYPDSDGEFTVTLRAGLYNVTPVTTRPFVIDVPDTTNTYTLLSRITTALSFTTGIPATNGVPLASEDDWGKVKTDVTDADPIVYTKASVDALLADKADAPDGAALLLIPPFEAGINTLSVPVARQIFQRTNDTSGFITITAQVAGPTGTEVEARFDGGAWETIGESNFTGAVTGYLAADVGIGTLEVRVVGSSTSTTVATGIGDIFAVWGQSNASGRLTANQSFTGTTGMAVMLGNDYECALLTDPVDTSTGQVDTISSDTDPTGMGSWWPLLANDYVSATGIPVAFVPCAKGSTSFTSSPSWVPDADPLDRSTLFGSALYRTQLSGARAVLWYQQESGLVNLAAVTNYVLAFSNMVATARTVVTNLDFIPAKIAETVGVANASMTNAWYAQGLLSSLTGVKNGPVIADAPTGAADNIFTEDEGTGTPYFHIKSATNAARISTRYLTNLTAHY
jgi:hypothetical protein